MLNAIWYNLWKNCTSTISDSMSPEGCAMLEVGREKRSDIYS